MYKKNMPHFQKIFDRENFRDKHSSIVSKYSPCTHNLLLKKQICFSYPIPSNNEKKLTPPQILKNSNTIDFSMENKVICE